MILKEAKRMQQKNMATTKVHQEVNKIIVFGEFCDDLSISILSKMYNL